MIKIATYNINGIRSRLTRLLDWLDREKPDIVCLQELKCADFALPKAEIEGAGYGAAWLGQSSWNGVAVLVRDGEPIVIRKSLPSKFPDDQSRYLEVAALGMAVGCLYLPNGNPQPGQKFEYKLKWFDDLIAHAATLYNCGQPVVLAGDYNVVPTDIDIYDPSHWRKNALLQTQSRERYSRLLTQGWLDTLRSSHPEQRIYTFWDYFRQHWQRNAGLRIDHLLLNEVLAPKLHDAGVDSWVRGEEGASDHAPVWIRLSSSRRTRKAVAESARHRTSR